MKTAKRPLTVLLAVLMIFGLLVPGALAAETDTIEPLSFPFTDVAAGSWYRSYVQSVLDQNIMQGTSSTRFSPNDTFSRGQIVATLFRIHHNRNANANDNRNNPFNDIGNAWYTPYVTWAHNNGISSGTSATRFGANDHVTRQEIATIMHNYVRNLTDHNSGSTATAQWNAFTDRGQITFPGAYNAFRWANNHGIVNGVSSTRLEPNGTATRAQAAAMLVRLVNFMGGSSQQPGDIDTLTRNGATWYELRNAGFSRVEIQGAFEREIIRLVNNIRRDNGLWEFTTDARTATVARNRAVESMVNNSWTHRSEATGLEQEAHWRQVTGAGANDWGFENLGGTMTTAQALVQQWMNSPGHRDFIMVGHHSAGGWSGANWSVPARLTQIGVGFDFCQTRTGNHNYTRSMLWLSTSF